jgi:hypothetical protein
MRCGFDAATQQRIQRARRPARSTAAWTTTVTVLYEQAGVWTWVGKRNHRIRPPNQPQRALRVSGVWQRRTPVDPPAFCLKATRSEAEQRAIISPATRTGPSSVALGLWSLESESL